MAGMLGARVKRFIPKVHGGLLYRRNLSRESKAAAERYRASIASL